MEQRVAHRKSLELPEAAPFNNLLGVKVHLRSPERSEAELTVSEELCNRRGVLHGGAAMALGDALGGMTATSSLPAGSRNAALESNTNFFAAVPLGDTVRAVCIPLHRGRTTVLETRITRRDGKLAAIVTQTQLILGTKNDGYRYARTGPIAAVKGPCVPDAAQAPYSQNPSSFSWAEDDSYCNAGLRLGTTCRAT